MTDEEHFARVKAICDEIDAINARRRHRLEKIAERLGYASVEDYHADLLAREERSKLHVV